MTSISLAWNPSGRKPPPVYGKTKKIIDSLHAPEIGKRKKVRTYRHRARREYLRDAKKRKVSKKNIRKAVRKQWSYVKRNLKHEEKLGVLRNLWRKYQSV